MGGGGGGAPKGTPGPSRTRAQVHTGAVHTPDTLASMCVCVCVHHTFMHAQSHTHTQMQRRSDVENLTWVVWHRPNNSVVADLNKYARAHTRMHKCLGREANEEATKTPAYAHADAAAWLRLCGEPDLGVAPPQQHHTRRTGCPTQPHTPLPCHAAHFPQDWCVCVCTRVYTGSGCCV